MKTRNEKIQNFINELDSKIDIDLKYYCSTVDVESFEDIEEAIENNGGFNIDIIYYSRAIEYLKENDVSLTESMSLAIDYGIKLENINSELLASLLASQEARDNFYEYQDEIETFFNELNEEED
jgi:hypothetical protein